MKRIFSSIIVFFGYFLIFIGILSGLQSLSSYLERLKHGPGLLFADVELFAITAIAALFLGILAIWLGKKIKRPDKKSNRNKS